MIGKAKFNNVAEFCSWAKDNWTNWGDSIYKKHEFEYYNWKYHDTFKDTFIYRWNDSNPNFSVENNKKLMENFNEILEYLTSNNLSFGLSELDETDGFAVLCYGKVGPIIVPLTQLTITLYKDYNDIPVVALNQIGTGEGLIPTTALDNVSINSTKSAIDDANKQLNDIKKGMEDIQHCKDGALAEMKAAIEKMERELRAEKQRQMDIMNQKRDEMNIQIKQLENQIFVLDTQIYGIRCFVGESIEFTQLRNGKKSNIEESVVLYQKVRYMDEELGKLASIYDIDWNEKDTFESWLKVSPLALETFAPNDKCITLVRVSKEKRYLKNNRFERLIYACEKYQGDRIGIIIRNGENLYIGWTDSTRISVRENVFYKVDTKFDATEDDSVPESDTKEDIASRYFVFAILQGLIKESNIINLPKNENIMKPSKYVIYSVADAWLVDNTYGPFSSIVKRVNSQLTVGDTLLILGNLYDDKHWNSSGRYFEDCDRCHGENNRTQDMSIKSGEIYRINLLEDDEVYIQGRKDVYTYYSSHEATANFRVYDDEFMNLTYMNSVWIDYVIKNGNISDWTINGQKARYAEVIKFLKIAKEHVLEREDLEKAILLGFIPSLESIPNWQVLLSEWKLDKKVRFINEYQAKRFSKSVETLTV